MPEHSAMQNWHPLEKCALRRQMQQKSLQISGMACPWVPGKQLCADEAVSDCDAQAMTPLVIADLNLAWVLRWCKFDLDYHFCVA